MSEFRTIVDLLDAAKARIGMAARVFSAPSTPTDGEKDVAAAGTAEALSATAVPMRAVTIVAKPANGGSIYVGLSTVSSTRYLAALTAGQTVEVAAKDLADIFIDSSVNGEGAWLYIFK